MTTRACVFDAYGTLFDFASAANACADVLGDKTTALTTLWRDKQLQYTWLRTLQNQYVPFDQVTAEALDFALTSLAITTAGLRDRLLALYQILAPFPEVPSVLASLKTSGIKTAILSNGSHAMLAPLTNRSGIRESLDHVISADEVRAFKTHPSVYQRAVDRLAIPAADICFFSSNAWDAWAASAFGMRVIWCNRTGAPRENLPGHPDAEIHTLQAALKLIETPSRPQ